MSHAPDPEEVREQGMTPDDLMNRELATPKTECEWVPEWDDHPESRPGENLTLEDGVLSFDREGFHVELESYETTHWRARITIPSEYGEHHARPIDVKSRHAPEHGYVSATEIDEYELREVSLVIAENYMPIYELEQWVDDLIERTESSVEYIEQFEAAMDAAHENKDKD